MFEQLKTTLKRITKKREKTALVLCYHRIANEAVDPWRIVVSPKNFKEQLQVLSNYFSVVGINDLVSDFDKHSGKDTVCLTFDDGYGDNYRTAQPLLKKYNTPACFFIASGFIGKDRLFWWDELEEIILLTPTLPAFFSIEINGEGHSFDLGSSATLNENEMQRIAQWKYHKIPVNRRCVVFLRLWELLRSLIPAEQAVVMNKLRDWSDFSKKPIVKEKLPMTATQLQELANDSLSTIGLHTFNHAALGFHSKSFQEQEITQNQLHLKQLINKEADIISFPFGSYNSDTLDLVSKIGLKASFTSLKKPMKSKADLYQLGRFAVKNWEGATFKKKLMDWFEAS